jgi:hypothetical protein
MPDTRCIAPTSTSGHANKEDDQIDIAEGPAATAASTGLSQEPVEPGSAHAIWNDIYLSN